MRNKITFLSMLLFTVFSFIAKAQPGSNDTSFDPGTGEIILSGQALYKRMEKSL